MNTEITTKDIDNLNRIKKDIKQVNDFLKGRIDESVTFGILNTKEDQKDGFAFYFEYPTLDEVIEARTRLIGFLNEFTSNNKQYTFTSKILSNDEVNKLTIIISKDAEESK